MGLLSKLFKGPEINMEKSNANASKMRVLFNHVVEDGDSFGLVFSYTEDVRRFNYGFVHGSKSEIAPIPQRTTSMAYFPDRQGGNGR